MLTFVLVVQLNFLFCLVDDNSIVVISGEKVPNGEVDISDVALCWDCEVASIVDLDISGDENADVCVGCSVELSFLPVDDNSIVVISGEKSPFVEVDISDVGLGLDCEVASSVDPDISGDENADVCVGCSVELSFLPVDDNSIVVFSGLKSPFVELDISDVALGWDCEVASSVDPDISGDENADVCVGCSVELSFLSCG